jgi:hypothetical protein
VGAGRSTRAWWRIVAVVLASALVAAACGDDDAPEQTTRSSVTPTIPGPPPTFAADGNMLANPGFEDGRTPWVSIEPPEWERDTAVAHGGEASALLRLDVPGQGEHVISYLVQEVGAEPFPEKISGWYRVDDWARGTPNQYLQFVVIVRGADNAPDIPGYPEDAEINHQIRYPLVGIDAEPFDIDNAKFLFVTREREPKQGEWVYFERPLADDFREQWGEVPEGYERIRLLLEVRVDQKLESTPATATVHYDDVFMGTPS